MPSGKGVAVTNGDRAVRKARPLTRAEMQRQTREEVLNAAEALFLAGGYRDTTVAQIAVAAGRTQGAIYANFAGKEYLCLEVLQRRALTILGEVVAKLGSAGSTVDDKVETILETWGVLSQDVGVITLAADYILATRSDPEQQAALTGQIKALKALIGVAVSANLTVSVSVAQVDRVVTALLTTFSGLAFGQATGLVTAAEAGEVLEDTLRVWITSLESGAAAAALG
jgi:AcrR family transcriptional regulator